MAIVLRAKNGANDAPEEKFGLECPYCGVYAHMTPQSTPNVAGLLTSRPKHVGLVYQCDACQAPIFLRFAVKTFADDHVELYQNFIELERPKERFAFSYLPRETEVLFREALSCYSHGDFNAFASMCRRSAESAFQNLGDQGKLRAFDEVMVAREIAGIDEDSFEPIKDILFDTADSELPLITRSQAGVLLEILKDLFYQCFVRRGKLTRAIKVRRFFVQDGHGELLPSA